MTKPLETLLAWTSDDQICSYLSFKISLKAVSCIFNKRMERKSRERAKHQQTHIPSPLNHVTSADFGGQNTTITTSILGNPGSCHFQAPNNPPLCIWYLPEWHKRIQMALLPNHHSSGECDWWFLEVYFLECLWSGLSALRACYGPCWRRTSICLT